MDLNSFLNPKSVAIIGASNDPGKLGYQILNNLKSGFYRGSIYPINLREKTVLGLPAFYSIDEVRGKVDLALIVIPAAAVVGEIRNCAVAGVKNFIVISAGFSEGDADGKKREEELKKLAAEQQLNILGPNCLGLVNAAAKLNLTFANAKIKPGAVAFLSQSGALGSAALDALASKPYGFSKFVSLGNKAVLDENDFFEELIGDDSTKLVVAYLESVSHGERLMSAVSRLSKKKPVAVLKAGQTEQGARAAMSHTGSLAGSSQAVLAGLRRAGAIILDSPEELFDLIDLAQREYQITDDKLTIISNAGGPLVLATDEAAKIGLPPAEFSRQTISDLRLNLPQSVVPHNPLDLIGDAPAERYRLALETVLSREPNANLLVILTPQTSTQVEETAAVIAAAAKKYPKTIITACFMGGDSVAPAREALAAAGVPEFPFPERAVRVLAKLISNRIAAKSIKPYASGRPHAIRAHQEQLDYLEAIRLLERYGIDTVPTREVGRASELAEIPYPAVLKAVGKKLVHKTDRAAIALNLKNQVQANVAWNRFKDILRDKNNYCVAQPMVEGGIELILGFKRDPSFGPVLLLGWGGIYTEIFKDITTEIADLDQKRALAMIGRLKSFPILKGARGKHFAIDALADAILKVAKLSQKEREILELDINPLFLTGNGAVAADVRIII